MHYATRLWSLNCTKWDPGRPKNGGDPVGSPPGPLDKHQPACKPGSVGKGHPSLTAIPLRRWLPSALSNLPGRPDPDIDLEHRSARAEASLAPSLFGLAPGGVC